MEKARVGSNKEEIFRIICSNPECYKQVGVMDIYGDVGKCEIYCSVKCWKEVREKNE